MSDKSRTTGPVSRIKSPDSLNDCIRVASPGVWLILAAVIVLLVGACVWGIFGHIDTCTDATAVVKGGVAEFSVSGDNAGSIPETVIAKVSGYEYILERSDEPILYGPLVVGTAETSLPDGEYPAKIVLEREKPISFVLN